MPVDVEIQPDSQEVVETESTISVNKADNKNADNMEVESGRNFTFFLFI